MRLRQFRKGGPLVTKIEDQVNDFLKFGSLKYAGRPFWHLTTAAARLSCLDRALTYVAIIALIVMRSCCIVQRVSELNLLVVSWLDLWRLCLCSAAVKAFLVESSSHAIPAFEPDFLKSLLSVLVQLLELAARMAFDRTPCLSLLRHGMSCGLPVVGSASRMYPVK